MARKISRLDQQLEDRDYIRPRASPLKEVAYGIFRVKPTISHTELYAILCRNHKIICPNRMTVYLWLKDWRYKDTIRALMLVNRKLLKLVDTHD